MGGGLALWLATLRPEKVEAAVPFYGVIPWPAAQPDCSRLAGPVQGHYAEERRLRERRGREEARGRAARARQDLEFFMYPGTEHAFTNHHRPEVHHADHTNTAWVRTLEFLRANVT